MAARGVQLRRVDGYSGNDRVFQLEALCRAVDGDPLHLAGLRGHMFQ